MHRVKLLHVFLTFVILFGFVQNVLAAKPPVITQITSDQFLELIIPKNLYRKSSGYQFSFNPTTGTSSDTTPTYSKFDPLFHGLEFEPKGYMSTSPYPKNIDGIDFKIKDQILSVYKYNGEVYSSGDRSFSSVEYKMQNTIEEKDNFWIIKLSPYEKIETIGRNALFFSYKLPSFEINELMSAMKNITFSINIDKNSEYNADSTKANFNRLMKLSYDSKKTYTAKVGECNIRFNADFFPYKAGSKITGVVDASCKMSSNTIDLLKLSSEIDSYISSVLNN
ncbi:hypothetical protein [Seleniivibrio woodruffii]|uniref:hypothetical protein n=1 Tax=Seleniivibrio woodruffii TaxID=1078050 RepID=UPI0024090CA9|nr:hypothetical protein [Seleniivibrio woodruffii]